ncbi:MAG: hypothetical protein ABI831_06935 [Betaproteobacteria bacterium]
MTAHRILEIVSSSAAMFALCAMAGSFTVVAAGPLDGKVFVGEAGEKGKPADEKNDIITFADGKFHSSACDQWGFNKAEYTARTEGDATVFEAETVSDKEGRLKWKGTLKGGVIEGAFVHLRKPAWYRPNPEPIEHWFKAVPKS